MAWSSVQPNMPIVTGVAKLSKVIRIIQIRSINSTNHSRFEENEIKLDQSIDHDANNGSSLIRLEHFSWSFKRTN